MAGEDTSPEGFGRMVQKLADIFYVENILLAYPRPAQLQEALEILT